MKRLWTLILAILTGAAFSQGMKTRRVERLRAILPEPARRYAEGFEYATSRYPVDPLLLAALVRAESSFNPRARRHEPEYQRRYVTGSSRWEPARRLGWSDEQLATSWGLTQVLGATAWSMGWHEPPAAILDPATNLTLGAKYLHQRLERYDGDVKRALIAYNGGHGAVLAYNRGASHPSIGYAERVLRYWREYQGTAGQ